MKSGIYFIVNLVNSKLYVGSAVDFEKRWKNHRIELRLNRHCNIYLQAAWNKHGESNFAFYVIEHVDRSQLVEREQYWIDRSQCCDREKGYNLAPTAGSLIGFKPTQETLEKLSKIRKGKKRSEEFKKKISDSWKTRVVSEEAKRNMSLAHIGRKPSEETRKKMSEAQLGNTVNLGRKQTEEHKAKIAAGKKARESSKSS